MSIATLPSILVNNESEKVNYNNLTNEQLSEMIQKIKDNEGITYAEMAKKTGVHRSRISLFVNQGKESPEVRTALIKILNMCYGESPANFEYSHTVEIFHTGEFNAVLGFCEDMRIRRKMGVIIGYPGSGKTTAVKEYIDRTDGAVYIEAFPSMRMNDMFQVLAEACGVELKRGSAYKKAQQIITALKGKNLTFVIDEAEYLEKWDTDKFDMLRKIWDNTHTPIIFVGTPVLEELLTRGTGNDNLAQLYRRKYMMKLQGVKEQEIRNVLKKYKITKQAEDLLVAIAIDVKHGGMGNFTEVLELALEAAEGGEISADIVKNATNYKMLY